MKTAIALTLCLTLAACASDPTGARYRPVIDTKGKSLAQIETDLLECQRYAEGVAGAADQAAAGAVAGAIFGALMASAAGGGYSRNRSAGVGAVSGMAAGAASGETDQRNVIRRCMSGRGYQVLQ